MRTRLTPLVVLPLFLVSAASAQTVPIPVPSAQAAAFHGELFWLWLLGQALTLAVPVSLVFSGRGAALARRCLALCRERRALATLLFAASVGLLCALPFGVVDLVRRQRLAPYFGAPPPNIVDGLLGQIVPTLGIVLVMVVAGWALVAIIRRSPRWSWLWVSLGFTVVASTYLMVKPLADAQVRAYPRIENSAFANWSPRVASIIARTGARDVPVLVQPSQPGGSCRLANAAIGLGPTRAIVLSDQIFSKWEPAMVDVAVAHELKHYLFDNTWLPVVLLTVLSGVGAGAIQLGGAAVARRFTPRTGISSLAEPAALPLLLVLFLLYRLIAVPAFNLVAQKVEIDADRFALELTHDNRARALVSSSACGKFWLAEDPLFERLYFNTHPSMAERVRLANEYRPWETGGRQAYGDVLSK